MNKLNANASISIHLTFPWHVLRLQNVPVVIPWQWMQMTFYLCSESCVERISVCVCEKKNRKRRHIGDMRKRESRKRIMFNRIKGAFCSYAFARPLCKNSWARLKPSHTLIQNKVQSIHLYVCGIKIYVYVWSIIRFINLSNSFTWPHIYSIPYSIFVLCNFPTKCFSKFNQKHLWDLL